MISQLCVFVLCAVLSAQAHHQCDQSYNPYELLAQLPQNYGQESNYGRVLNGESSYAGISYDDVPLAEQESYAEARPVQVVAENFRSARPCVEEAAVYSRSAPLRESFAEEAINYQPIRESYSAPIVRESYSNYATPVEVSAPQYEAPAPIEVVTAPTQTRIVNLPAPIAPPPRVIGNTCTCRKTVIKPQVYQREIRIPIITKYIQKKYVPVVEKIRYNARGQTGTEPASPQCEEVAAPCTRGRRIPRCCSSDKKTE